MKTCWFCDGWGSFDFIDRIEDCEICGGAGEVDEDNDA